MGALAGEADVTALADSALSYAKDHGFYVFPLQERGKQPLVVHGLDDATTDLMTIEAWWERWPNANIAIRTGDLVVVDEDEPGALAALAFDHGQKLPVTRTVRTGKGRHYYFTQPADTRIRNTASKLAPGIDTRGDGGYVVAPPSIHPDGGTYQWEDTYVIAVLPDWMVALLAKPEPRRITPFAGRSTPYAQRALEQETHGVMVAGEGGRNHALNIAAFSLAQLVAGGELDEQDMRSSLEAAARACGLPDKEALATINSGIAAGLLEPRRAPESNGAAPAATNGRAAAPATTFQDRLNGDEPVTAPVDTWALIDLNTLPETPPVPPNLGDTHLVYPGKRHVFSGPPESAKTLAAYCVLIQTVRAGDLACLIDFEMGSYDARQRLRELGATPEEIMRIAYIEPDEPASRPVIERIINVDPKLVVIDAAAGVYSLEGLDDNKRLDVEKVSALYVKIFWRSGIATILIDHVAKNDEVRGKWTIGSERKLGGADVHLGFETVNPISRGTAGKYKVITHKDRGGFLKRGYLADLNLNSDPVTHAISWSFSEAVASRDDEGHYRPTIKMEQISKQLASLTEQITQNDLKRLVGGNAKAFGLAVEALVREGYVDSQDGPRGSKLLSLTRPYARSEDPLDGAPSQPTDSAIPVWFSSDSENQCRVTDSLIPSPYRGESVESPSPSSENQSETDDRFPDQDDLFGEPA